MNRQTRKQEKSGPLSFLSFIRWANQYVLAVVSIGFTVLLCIPLSEAQGYHVVSFVLLFVVSILATFMKIGPIFLASALSSLVWNFFFIPPHYTFHINKPEDILMFCMFFIIVLLNGVLTSRIRKEEQLARSREERTNALFQLTRGLSKAANISEILAVANDEMKKHFSFEPLFILQDGNNKLIFPGLLKAGEISSQNLIVLANWVFEYSTEAGRFTGTMPSSGRTCYPLTGSLLNPGVVMVEHEKPFNGNKKVFWETFLTLISNALEREFLEEMAKRARFLDESDRLYKTLFNSISHELRIPVATILGASDTLLTSSYSATDQSALFKEIFMASVRLNRLIENLLNMSRLESGRLTVRLDWYDINDLINKVTDDLKDELKPFSLLVSVPDDMPLVRIDFGLMEQVLYNLLFNACQHAPVASNIRLNVWYNPGELAMQVMDRGPGFPEATIKNVFRKFFRTEGSKTGGLGLGLSIVKGFVEAHDGYVSVENRKNGGARFTVKIPSGNPEIGDISK